MKLHRGTINLQSEGCSPDLHNVTDEMKRIVDELGVKNDIALSILTLQLARL